MLSNSNSIGWKKSLFVRALFVLLTIYTLNAQAEDNPPAPAPAEATLPEAAPLVKPSHGYGGFGLMLESESFSSSLGDSSASGAGMIFNGAGSLGLSDNAGLGFTGAMGFSSLTGDNSTTSSSTFLFDVDGGVVLQDVFYMSLGVKSQSQTFDDIDFTSTYTVMPIGIGMLSANDKGYLLTQFRFGAGQYSTDFSSSTEDVGYFGIKLVGQFGNELQFMGGLEMDNYSFTDTDATDFYFRMFFGMGFGK